MHFKGKNKASRSGLKLDSWFIEISRSLSRIKVIAYMFWELFTYFGFVAAKNANGLLKWPPYTEGNPIRSFLNINFTQV